MYVSFICLYNKPHPHFILSPAPLLYLLLQDSEIFMDTLNTPTYLKKLKRLSSQGPDESRKKWQAVTKALKERDVDAATDAKHAVSTLLIFYIEHIYNSSIFFQLEEQQRADARERKESGVEWERKLFHLEGDTWVFNNTLDKRTLNLPNPV